MIFSYGLVWRTVPNSSLLKRESWSKHLIRRVQPVFICMDSHVYARGIDLKSTYEARLTFSGICWNVRERCDRFT
jgi:hypothetical protein